MVKFFTYLSKYTSMQGRIQDVFFGRGLSNHDPPSLSPTAIFKLELVFQKNGEGG